MSSETPPANWAAAAPGGASAAADTGGSAAGDVVIAARGLGKCYRLYDRAGQQMSALLLGRWRQAGRPFWALRGADLALRRGEAIGIVGRNGAGKSTLLQLVCGTLTPSEGTIDVRGRVAALLELGAGFNPDYTGRENARLNAALLGMSRAQIDAGLQEIIDFAEIGEFIDQPVKHYSSGMFVRLAFAVATAVQPDVLVIDEALSVGDGAFSRKSFERIMALKERGAALLFCSHSMYQVEVLCSRALWVEGGRVVMDGPAAEVCAAYQASLNAAAGLARTRPVAAGWRAAPAGGGALVRVQAAVDGKAAAGEALLRSGRDTLELRFEYVVDPALPPPTLAVGISDESGLTVSSAISAHDAAPLSRDAQGRGAATLRFPRLPLLKGGYAVTAFLGCEQAMHLYDQVNGCVRLRVVDDSPEQGLVRLPHEWRAETVVDAPQGDGHAAEAAAGHTAGHTADPAAEAATAPAMPGDLDAPAAPAVAAGPAAPQAAAAPGAPAVPPRAARTGALAIAAAAPVVAGRALELRALVPADRAALLALHRAVFGGTEDEAWFAWKYERGGMVGAGLWEDGRLVAFCGGLPRGVRLPGQAAVQPGLQIGDVMVWPQWRGVLTRQGPFFHTSHALYHGAIGTGRPHALGFGFPNARHMKLGAMLGLGRDAGTVWSLHWPLQGPLHGPLDEPLQAQWHPPPAGGAGDGVDANGSPGAAAGAAGAAHAAGDTTIDTTIDTPTGTSTDSATHTAAHTAARTAALTAALTAAAAASPLAEDAPDWDPAVAAAWAAMAAALPGHVLGERTPQHLRWRYLQRPGRAHRLLRVPVPGAGGAAGVLVLAAEGGRMQWLDWVGPPQGLAAAVLAALQQARAQGCAELWGWASTALADAVAAALPPPLHPVRAEAARIGVPITSELDGRDPASLAWWWHGGDTDFL